MAVQSSAEAALPGIAKASPIQVISANRNVWRAGFAIA
jgi:hypothetical protein